jgi:hypothetical protein
VLKEISLYLNENEITILSSDFSEAVRDAEKGTDFGT